MASDPRDSSKPAVPSEASEATIGAELRPQSQDPAVEASDPATERDAWRIELEAFAGPMDLLLHLIKKEEVDVHDIPIARILDQYMKHLEVIRDLDLDQAGDFAVMAATLMVIKSRMLLPSEEVDFDEEIDPRYELVQQLLEHKRLRDSGGLLLDRAELFAQRAARPDTARPDTIVTPDRSIEELGLSDLLEAFSKVLESVGSSERKERSVAIEDRPVRAYIGDLVGRLASERAIRFRDLVAGASKPEIIGWFLAILVLLKRERLGLAVHPDHGDLALVDRGDAPEGGGRLMPDEAEAGEGLQDEDDFR